MKGEFRRLADRDILVAVRCARLPGCLHFHCVVRKVPKKQSYQAELPGARGTWLGHLGPGRTWTEGKRITKQKGNGGTKIRT